MTYLKALDLSYNNLRSQVLKSIACLEKLEYLNLSCDFLGIDIGVLSDLLSLRNLKSLNRGRNSFCLFPTQDCLIITFKAFSRLEYIDFSGNYLGKVSSCSTVLEKLTLRPIEDYRTIYIDFPSSSL